MNTINRSIAKHITFLYTMNQCHTISAPYIKKRKFLKSFKNNADLKNVAEVFKKPDADAQTITNSGLLSCIF